MAEATVKALSRAMAVAMSRSVAEAVSRAIYSGIVSSMLFHSPYFSSLPFVIDRRIDYTTLSFSPGEIKKRNVAFLRGLMAELRILALNSVITGETN